MVVDSTSPHILEGACHCGGLVWQLVGMPESATVCNCSICRRYGVLWAYGHEGETITLTGTRQSYLYGEQNLAFIFCPTCGCVAAWCAQTLNNEGKRRIAVNLRLTELNTVAHLPVRRFDGRHTFSAMPSDDSCVANYVFIE